LEPLRLRSTKRCRRIKMAYKFDPYQQSYTVTTSPRYERQHPLTAIFDAIQQNNVGLLRTLLGQADDCLNKRRNSDGKTPLMIAASENCPDVLQFLVSRPGVNIELKGSVPLDLENFGAFHVNINLMLTSSRSKTMTASRPCTRPHSRGTFSL
jgi:hypothetical protein